jgi:hypothetical protein
MKPKIILLLTGALILTLSSCIENLLIVKGNGTIVTETRRTQLFTKIENYTSLDVIYKKADTSGVVIIVDENLLDYIVTETENNTLILKYKENNSHLSFTEKAVIKVSSPRIESVSNSGSGVFLADRMSGDAVTINLSGSGDNSVSEIAGKRLTVMLTGSGKITLNNSTIVSSDIFLSGSGTISLSGKSDENAIKITGSGDVFSENFQTKDASVIISGSGVSYVNVSNALTGIITGSGNIYVRGNPVITKTITGSGRIIQYK